MQVRVDESIVAKVDWVPPEGWRLKLKFKGCCYPHYFLFSGEILTRASDSSAEPQDPFGGVWNSSRKVIRGLNELQRKAFRLCFSSGRFWLVCLLSSCPMTWQKSWVTQRTRPSKQSSVSESLTWQGKEPQKLLLYLRLVSCVWVSVPQTLVHVLRRCLRHVGMPPLRAHIDSQQLWLLRPLSFELQCFAHWNMSFDPQCVVVEIATQTWNPGPSLVGT